ncbi:photosynthesis system II assembly factor Ycf48 [Prochlorococcus marinus]|uniref:photosynthesis system II assembly factor Ycf48 n=1 Tax=Prochlorococcus marinus TaxID=1219 RepID=UPI001ADAF9EB|nr:photosynthesis system II assembly factor Ycf48 [Prochlorococcus marinus]MBO8203867.1 photosynthesis system II assembly factor Ycf48 [Prochlorococcus marinus CUG1415]MBW3043171.1 photosystem II assembly protein [Prochlorococcus marinus str. MU1415]
MKKFLTSIPNLLLSLLLCFVLSSCSSTGVKVNDSSPWKTIQFEDQANVLDVDFIDNNNGFLVGSNRLIMESNDGGETWDKRNLDLPSEENFRLLDIDFKGEEGWLIGQPSLVMHTLDSGKNWTRLSLGSKLPGQPFLITTVDNGVAELATTAGAIYQTVDSGESWSAKVVDASGSGGVRDLRRTKNGDYVSVSSLGNFFSTLASNSDTWVAHQRASSKRVQSIGFNPSGDLWMLSRGAEIRFNDNSQDLESWTKPIIPILNGYNYLDLGWDPNGDIWAGGGNGTLIVSKDKGKTWNSDPIAASLPTNFIKIVFLDKDQIDTQKGFIIGERGYILKWQG